MRVKPHTDAPRPLAAGRQYFPGLLTLGLTFLAITAVADPVIVPPSLNPGDHYQIAFVTSFETNIDTSTRVPPSYPSWGGVLAADYTVTSAAASAGFIDNWNFSDITWHAILAYPKTKRLLILCDGGGSNSATQYLFKEDLQRLANRLGLELRVAHYPPYCSKHNPIEHRVFPHVARACQGVIFHTLDIAQQFIARANTTTGLRVTVGLLEKVYATGRKYAENFKENMTILFDDHLPKWNYRAIPEFG